MTEEEKDEKEFEAIWKNGHPPTHQEGCLCTMCELENDEYPEAKKWFCKGRRTLREKIKADHSIGKLVIDGDWLESPDY